MNLRRRTLITIALSLLLLVGTLYIISQSLLMGSISEIQDDNTEKDIKTIKDHIFRELEDLNAINNHWATLGENSIIDEQSQVILPETEKILITSDIDFIIITSSQEGLVYFKTLDNQENNLSDYKADLERYLENNNSITYPDNPTKNRQGILLISNKTFLISTNYISGSQNKNLILARNLNINKTGQLKEIPGLSLEITPYIGNIIPIFYDVDQSFSYDSPIISKRTENNIINAFYLLRDGQGRAVFQIKISENPYIEYEGQKTLINFIFLFLIIGLILGLIILIYLDRLVLFRINRLSYKVQEITKNNNLSHRLQTNETNDEISGLSNAINSLLASLEHSLEEIKQSRLKYKNIFNNTGTAMIIIDEEGKISLVNSEFENLSGYKKEEVENKKEWKEFFPEDIKKMSKYRALRQINSNKAPRNYEASLLNSKGELKNLYITITTIPGTKESLGSLMDITILKKSLKEKEALLREVNHRVRNNMQIIISMFSIQALYSDDEDLKNFLIESQDRIRAMALVFDGLSRSKDMSKINIGEYIEKLTNELFISHNVEYNLIKLQINVDNVLVSIDTAVPFGLLINELITTSIKQTFKPEQNGEIKVELSFNDEIILIIEVNGIGLSKVFDINNPNTMGMELIDALIKQLNATMEVTVNEGTRLEIKFKELVYKKRI